MPLHRDAEHPSKSLYVRQLCMSALPRALVRSTSIAMASHSSYSSLSPAFLCPLSDLAIFPVINMHYLEPLLFAPSLGRCGLTFDATSGSPPCVARDFVRLRCKPNPHCSAFLATVQLFRYMFLLPFPPCVPSFSGSFVCLLLHSKVSDGHS